MSIELYDYHLSGNCYKVRLLLSMLHLDYRRIELDLRGGATLTPEFKRINPRSQVPVLVDDGEIIWDSMAILVYLARRYGEEHWLPHAPLGEARAMQWLAVSENELLYGLARARAVLRLQRPFDLAQCQQEGNAGLALLESRLSVSDWLAADLPCIADIACYPYVVLAPEGEVPLEPWPAVQAWLRRVEALPGWVPMEGQ